MTLIEILTLSLWVAGVAVAGVVIGERLGPWAGVLASVCVGAGAYGLARGFARVTGRWRPSQPRCRAGACGAQDYRWLRLTPDGAVLECKCGDRYLMSPRRFGGARRFLWMDGDRIVPYMSRRPFRGWRPE